MTHPLPPPTPELRRYAQAIGLDGLLRLLEARGGTRLAVPIRTDRSQLVTELGSDLAELVVKHWAGQILRVPLGRAWRVQIYHGRGMSYAAIATRVGLTEQGVWRILSTSGLTHDAGAAQARTARPSRAHPAPAISPQLDLLDWLAPKR